MGLIFPSALNFPIGQYTAYCAGQLFNVPQNSALFSLLGTTFGGNGVQNFGIPDLRGRVPIGTTNMGAGSPTGLNIPLGQATSNPNTILTIANLPTHNHAATFTATTGQAPISITVGSGGTGLNASVPALNVNGTLTVSTANGTVSTPAASAVPATIPQIPFTGPQGGNKSVFAYGTATAPNTANWTVGGTTATGTAPVNGTINGNASTVTGGTVTVGVTGSGQAFSNLPPYLGLAYLIITQGLYPTRD